MGIHSCSSCLARCLRISTSEHDRTRTKGDSRDLLDVGALLQGGWLEEPREPKGRGTESESPARRCPRTVTRGRES
jgi:hypothetical protein